ncbi:MAG TPA: TPM domain-containing protein [Candidatus Binatia bacterium]|nr:TPM domain-containing protein [Candidatus Binatia bacterium]
MNDYAGVLGADARRQLESRLAAREGSTGVQMTIAVFPSLEGESPADYGTRLFEKWKVGDKRLDNGLLLLVFVREHRIWIVTGYGLEPVLTDAVVGQIVRDTIAPQFRERGYAAGLQAGIDAIFARLPSRGAPPAPPHRAFGVSPWTLGVLVLIGIIAMYLLREAAGGGGGRGHGYTAGGRRGWSPPIFTPPMGGGGWGGGRDSDSGPTFTPGGGSTGGGGAGGEW